MLGIMNLFMFVCDSSVVSSVLMVQILWLTLSPSHLQKLLTDFLSDFECLGTSSDVCV